MILETHSNLRGHPCDGLFALPFFLVDRYLNVSNFFLQLRNILSVLKNRYICLYFYAFLTTIHAIFPDHSLRLYLF